MNRLIIHLCRKDVRHLRGFLLVWVLLVSSQAVLIGSGISASADDMATQVIFQVLSVVLPMLKVLAVIVMIPLLIHGEPLTGTTAFWFSRPLSRSTVLAAKSLFIGLILILFPLLIELAVFFGNGVQLRHILSAVPEILIDDTSLVLEVMILAVLTRNFARFAIAGVILFIALILFGVATQILRLYFGGMDAVMNAAQGMDQSRRLVGNIIVMITGLAVVVNQYLTRKTTRSIIMAAAGGFLMFLSTTLWGINFFAEPKSAPDAGVVDCDQLIITLNPRQLSSSDEFQMRRTETPQKEISAELDAEGLGDEYIACPTEITSRLEFPDGTILASTNRLFNGFGTRSVNNRALAALFEGYELLNTEHYSFSYSKILSVASDQYYKYGRTDGVLSLEVEAAVSSYRLAAEIPLREGARYSNGSEHLVVSRIMKQTGGCTVLLRQSRVNLLFGGRETRGASSSRRSSSFDSDNVIYVLRNKARREVYLPAGDMDHTLFSRGDQRLSVTPVRLIFEPNRFAGEGELIDEEWLNGADLVRIEEVRLGFCNQSLQVDAFQMCGEESRRHFSGERRKGPDPDILKGIVLPENPTRAEAEQYVKSIVEDAEKQICSSPKDPQVDMLVALGPQYVDLLLKYKDQYHVRAAVKRLVGPEHKELIVRELPTCYDLIDVVLDQGWESDVHDILIGELKKQPEHLPQCWIQAVAGFEDPATYDDLKLYLVRGNGRSCTYDAIKNLPGIDLRDAVGKAWKRSRYESSDYERQEMIYVAIHFGNTDALAAAAKLLAQDDKDHSYNVDRIRKALKPLLPDEVSPDDFPAWYQAHQTALYFDENTRRYQVRNEKGPITE